MISSEATQKVIPKMVEPLVTNISVSKMALLIQPKKRFKKNEVGELIEKPPIEIDFLCPINYSLQAVDNDLYLWSGFFATDSNRKFIATISFSVYNNGKSYKVLKASLHGLSAKFKSITTVPTLMVDKNTVITGNPKEHTFFKELDGREAIQKAIEKEKEEKELLSDDINLNPN